MKIMLQKNPVMPGLSGKIRPDSMKKSGKSGSSRILKILIQYTSSRYTWRHNTMLKFMAQIFPSLQPSKLYVDLSGYLSPSILTGETLFPDVHLTIEDKFLYTIERAVGFETNLVHNAERKEIKYRPLPEHFENTCHTLSCTKSWALKNLTSTT